MQWYRDLYVGDGIAPSITNIIERIESGKIVYGAYLIVISDNAYDNLEIISTIEMFQKYYKEKELFIVGVAKDKEESIELVTKIVADCFEKTKGYELKNYLLQGSW